jgi:hypothetical protein
VFRSKQDLKPKHMVRGMNEHLIKTIEQDLRQVVQTEIMRFRDRYRECKNVDSIYFNEDFSVIVYDIILHGLVCDQQLNAFVTSDRIYEFQEFRCYIVFEDKEMEFKRNLGHIILLYTPVTNNCFIKTELHEEEIRETAEHIVRAAGEMENEN